MQKNSKFEKELQKYLLEIVYQNDRPNDDELIAAIQLFSCSRDDYVLQK